MRPCLMVNAEVGAVDALGGAGGVVDPETADDE
jgi:hypothetical protein